MADLIDRDAVLSDINEEIEANQEYPEDKLIRKGLRIARKAIENASTVNRWIPVSERLPVLYVPVMILTDDGSYAIAHVTGNEDEYLWFGDGGHCSKDYVLFWMPLPEPPNEDET